jgi:hypothetical protein
MSVSAEIMSPVNPPVIVDGIFQHNVKTDQPFETDITVPKIIARAARYR